MAEWRVFPVCMAAAAVPAFVYYLEVQLAEQQPMRLASSVIPEPVQRRVTDFDNWLTGPEQIPQVLNEIVEHVRIILRDNRSKLERVIPL